MSTFSGLNTASTALWAQRRGLDVTGQNIANVNTDGYSRQRADLQSVGGTPVPAFHSVSRSVGSGVDAGQVMRIRDSWLEGRAHTERAVGERLAVETEAYALVEAAFREPGDTGIQSLLSDMWAGWSDVANNPQDEPARSQLLERTQTLVNGMHAARAALDQQWGEARSNLSALVGDVNSAAGDIATLNRAIQRATQSGLPTNELADKRDALVLTLAEKVGATVRPGEDGVVNVQIGGITLVAGATATRLSVQGASTPDAVDSDRPRIETVPGGSVADVGGRAGGQLAVLTTIVPGNRNALDRVAQRLVDQVNPWHRQGFDLDGGDGRNLFGPESGPVTAANIRVLITDPRQVGAAAQPPDAVTGPSADGSHADAIAQLRLEADSPDTLHRGNIVELGVQAAVSKRNLEIQATVAMNVDAARESVAGVNLDEEMSNMLQFQHAYSAAARMITAIDEALDVLINRTGAVGR